MDEKVKGKSQKVKRQGKRQKFGGYKFFLLPFALNFYLLPFTFFLGDALDARAEDATLTEESVVVKTEGAHRLLLPRDWPVEHKDGRIAPVAIEEYLSMKFGQVRQKFDEASERIDRLERRVKLLEEERSKLQQRLRALEERASPQP